jgi:transcriptional regulator with XRE-family HTH domain
MGLDETKLDEIKKERAVRVKWLRTLTGLSRRDFAKRYGIPPGTIQNWEEGKGGGITEKGAHRIVSVLQSANIHASFEWLMHGVGADPVPPTSVRRYVTAEASAKYATQSDTDQELQWIESEMALFCQHYVDAVTIQVDDDSMQPYFYPNDQVAGVRLYGLNMQNAVGKHCIVLTKDGHQLLRFVKKSQLPGFYNLACTNFKTDVKHAYLYDVELVSAAPVIWVRRKAFSE